MLAYLLDENISFVVTDQLNGKNSQIIARRVYRWQGGAFVGQTDARLLRAAAQDQLTLVTYDLKTIPPLLSEMAADNEVHTGVIFVDDTSIRNNDFGGLVKSLLAHWQLYASLDWNNRVAFLEPITRD